MTTIEEPTVEPREESLAASHRRTILIVDDDPAQVEVLSHRLRNLGFQAISAHSGEAGLRLAKSEHPDLVLLDLRLPDTDGLSVCSQLVDSPATNDIPVIIVSGMEQPDIIRRTRAAGCRFYLRKPYDPNALLTLIQNALDAADEW